MLNDPRTLDRRQYVFRLVGIALNHDTGARDCQTLRDRIPLCRSLSGRKDVEIFEHSVDGLQQNPGL